MTYGMDLRSDEEKDILKRRWVRGDRRACNIKLVMGSGQIVRCDSFVLYKYSNRYKEQNQPVQRIIQIEDLDAAYVEEAIGWMYDIEVKVNPEKMWNLMKAAFHFEMDELEIYLKQVINNIDYIFVVLNIASKDMIEEKPHSAFRGEWTFWQRKIYNRAFHAVLEVFYEMEPSFGMRAISQLNVTSIYALMYDLVDLKTKVRIVFLTIDWIVRTRPSLQSLYGILGSLRGNLSYNMLYGIKWHMYMFLTKYYSSPTEFYIWMDGTSEFVLASGRAIAAIPPKMLAYPIDKNLPFSVSKKPRTPRAVHEHRSLHGKDTLTREPICGRYKPRTEGEQQYSFGEEHNNEAVGKELRERLKWWNCDVPDLPLQSVTNMKVVYFGTKKFYDCGGAILSEDEMKVKLELQNASKTSTFTHQTMSSSNGQSSSGSKSNSSFRTPQNGKGPTNVHSDYLYN